MCAEPVGLRLIRSGMNDGVAHQNTYPHGTSQFADGFQDQIKD